jgi:dienelactone hydrolase
MWAFWLCGCATDRVPSTDGGSSRVDAAVDAAARAPDASADVGSAGSRCTVTAEHVECPHETVIVRLGVTAVTDREIHYQVPLGAPPPGGFPVVLAFQGSLFSAELFWIGERSGPFGMYEQALVVARLLDAGFAVLTPEAHLEGGTFWDTNVPPFSALWETSNDHRLMLEIFERIADGDFGPVDGTSLFATGISSGGYMTSRMAVSYPGRFRALAIHSASYATCSGPLCSVPDALPADHPPTLFLHGEADATVPIATMRAYADALSTQGTPVATVVDPSAGHEWIADAPIEIPTWFASAR